MPGMNYATPWRPLAIACCTVALASLAACGGGGSTVDVASATTSTPGSTGTTSSVGGASVTQSPYLLFANDYIAYTAQTNGAYIHTIQGGDLYAQTNATSAASGYIYGNYSASQADMNRTGFYNYQFQAGTAPAATDYAQLVILAPQDASMDISQANTMLITMGNTVAPDSTHGNAKVFTVVLTDGTSTTTASDTCSFNQTLDTVGPGTLTATGVRNYAIPLSNFTCSKGSISGLQSTGLTTVLVQVLGSQNSTIVPSEYDTIALGTIGFTNWAGSAADVTALSQ